MKVLHISECIKGGIATYINELYQNKHISDDFILFAPSSHQEYLFKKISEDSNNKFFKRNSRDIKSLLYFFIFIARNIKKVKPDIIHLHGTFAGFFVRLYYAVSFKRPVIIYCSHGWSFLMDIGKYKRKFYLLIERLLVFKTDAIINISNFEYDQSLKLGFPSYKSIKITNSINSIINKRNSRIIKYSKNKVNFLFVGRLDKQKGFDKLYKYFSNNKDYVLHVVGDFVNSKNKKYPDLDNIISYGWIDACLIHNCYIDSDVVIIPSRWEGFGLVAIEAMKYSKPLIVSNRGALPEIVQNGTNGFIFNFDNFNFSLSEKINCLNNLGLNLAGLNSKRLFDKYYSKNEMVYKIHKLYSDLVDKN